MKRIGIAAAWIGMATLGSACGDGDTPGSTTGTGGVAEGGRESSGAADTGGTETGGEESEGGEENGGGGDGSTGGGEAGGRAALPSSTSGEEPRQGRAAPGAAIECLL